MSEQSRRRFLVAAGAGTVAVGAGAILVAGPAAAHSEPAKAAAPATRGDDLAPADTKVVAYVSDPARDEVTLMVDDRESVVHDRVLARALARAAREQVG
ncbi:twin-arginine translocation signal domain-containing protein [Jiangella alkaliphila]|uniref:Tat (Twin-arginine translocation) pathway signal sequence n=1 Tax=Jiangella alkaliphila TaxID=419479 RepID=A0A1H2L6U2_9ACTN|nr:twin-arginine translocation signal domain-containing protein [Jiangella alkaliphila]SDU76787.1 Tat (twin-arginine translocation) pathway signal sequence [Jiangella alkaliphila]